MPTQAPDSYIGDCGISYILREIGSIWKYDAIFVVVSQMAGTTRICKS